MSRRVAALVIGAALVVVVAVLILVLRSGAGDPGMQQAGPSATSTELDESAPAKPWPVTLYYAGPRGLLEVEGREIDRVEGLEAQTAALVESLVAGPLSEDWYSPLPPGTKVVAVDPGPDSGSLFVALGQESGGGTPAMGSHEEILMTYSLVNTLVENLDGVDRVAILWGSSQDGTVAGHIEGSRPRAPSMRWVARPGGS